MPYGGAGLSAVAGVAVAVLVCTCQAPPTCSAELHDVHLVPAAAVHQETHHQYISIVPHAMVCKPPGQTKITVSHHALPQVCTFTACSAHKSTRSPIPQVTVVEAGTTHWRAAQSLDLISPQNAQNLSPHCVSQVVDRPLLQDP
jgi:hypothetical protein